MSPNSGEAQSALMELMMLSEAATSAAPTKYAQNMRAGIHLGTAFTTSWISVKC